MCAKGEGVGGGCAPKVRVWRRVCTKGEGVGGGCAPKVRVWEEGVHQR